MEDAEGIVNVPGFGNADFSLFAVIPTAGGQPTYFEIGVDDPANVIAPPNPVEVQATIKTSGSGYHEYSYSTSTMISF